MLPCCRARPAHGEGLHRRGAGRVDDHAGAFEPKSRGHDLGPGIRIENQVRVLVAVIALGTDLVDNAVGNRLTLFSRKVANGLQVMEIPERLLDMYRVDNVAGLVGAARMAQINARLTSRQFKWVVAGISQRVRSYFADDAVGRVEVFHPLFAEVALRVVERKIIDQAPFGCVGLAPYTLPWS